MSMNPGHGTPLQHGAGTPLSIDEIAKRLSEMFPQPPASAPVHPRDARITLWVCANRVQQMRLAEQMGLPKATMRDAHNHVVAIGANIAAYRYATVIVTESAARDLHWSPAHNRWFEDTVECRLLPGGKVVEL